MKLRDLIKQKMTELGYNPTDLSRESKLNIRTITNALNGDGKLSTYHKIADVMGVKIKFTVE